jgi:dTDP-4-dehydrorhamnose reductase
MLKRKVLVTGSRGQLGSFICGMKDELYDFVSYDSDIMNPEGLYLTANDMFPELVIHCAAFTNVDSAAISPRFAYKINGMGTDNVARMCAELQIPMVYISSNEVFDGEKNDPYREFDQPNPINPYGYSKYAGEVFVKMRTQKHFIVRTSWLTGYSGKNFFHKMVELGKQADEPLRIVYDEFSNPTFVPDLAQAIIQLTKTHVYGIYHLTNEGCCSRYEFAREIFDLMGIDCETIPVPLSSFYRKSTPPKYSPLDNVWAAGLDIRLPHWKKGLESFVKPLIDNQTK